MSEAQVKYAALDALVTGDLFRALRQLHANPRPCQGCSLPLGCFSGNLDLRCQHMACKDKRPYQSPGLLLKHMRKMGHKGNIQR